MKLEWLRSVVTQQPVDLIADHATRCDELTERERRGDKHTTAAELGTWLSRM
jgi:hypothetical protein